MKGVVVAAWIFFDDQVLLVHHKKLNRWVPVGGHVESGESLVSALRREVLEEVNLSVELLSEPALVPDSGFSHELPLPFRLSSYVSEGGDELALDFIARVDDVSQLLLSDELVDYQWFSLSEVLGSRFLSDRVKSLAKAAFAYYGRVK